MFFNKPPTKDKSVVREYVEAILIALVLALFIRSFVVQAFKIPSGSMEPTLLIGDHLLVNKFLYGVKNPFSGATWISYKNPERSDVIVFKYPVNPNPITIPKRANPTNHTSSLGFLYAPHKNTCDIWANTITTMADEPQKW